MMLKHQHLHIRKLLVLDDNILMLLADLVGMQATSDFFVNLSDVTIAVAVF